MPPGPWPAGVDRAPIDAAVDAAMGDGGFRRLRAIAVVHEGRLVYERYSPSPDDTPDTVFPSFSVAKSIASAVIGVAVRDGLLDVGAPAPVDAWSPPDPRSDITLDHLLRMTSGLAWEERPTGADLFRMLRSGDAAAYVAARPLADPPGSTFTYSTGSTVLLARILADALPPDDTVGRFVQRELAGPLGLVGVRMEYDPAGTWLAGASADLILRDYARFGLLVLQDGVWDGRRILPAGWVDYLRTPTPANRRYGAHWWLDPSRPGALDATGLLGQRIAVVPEHDLVVVLTATSPTRSDRVADVVLDAFAGA